MSHSNIVVFVSSLNHNTSRFPPSLYVPQLYIKISEEVGQQTSPEEMTDSLAISLVDPHLPLLSQYWLAALLDHAHLSLPPRFSRQLPPSGGTFYSNNVAANVRPYFQQNWPSLLHAAAIWLKTVGFSGSDDTTQEGASAPLHPLMLEPLLSAPPGSAHSVTPPPLGDPKKDRLHLVLGLAVQTLCAPATLDSLPILLHCLRTLQRLLEAEFVQLEMRSDVKIAVEVLHLLHRLLLTCQSHDHHVIVMQIAVLVGQALQGKGAAVEDVKLEEGSSEDYEKTPMFALMEVAACSLLRLVPDLRPPETPGAPPSHVGGVTAGEIQVASLAVSLLISAVEISSVAECVEALPTVLHILVHMTKFSSHNQPISGPLLSASLHSLQHLLPILPLSHPSHGHTLSNTLRAALASLLLGPRSINPPPSSTIVKGTLSETDREVKLLVLTVLVQAPTAEVCPAGSELFSAATSLFVDCLTSTDEKVRHTHTHTEIE